MSTDPQSTEYRGQDARGMASGPSSDRAALAARLASLAIPRERRPNRSGSAGRPAPPPLNPQPNGAERVIARVREAAPSSPAGELRPFETAAPEMAGASDTALPATPQPTTTQRPSGGRSMALAASLAIPRGRADASVGMAPTLGRREGGGRRSDWGQPMQPGEGRWFNRIVGLVVVGGLVGGVLAFSSDISAAIERLRESTAGGTAGADGPRTLVVTTQAGGGPPPVLIAGGKIVSDQKVFVSTKVSGQIVEMCVEQGDRVEAGKTVIARIETVNYEARLRQTQAELQRAQREVQRLECEAAKSRASLAGAQAGVERSRAQLAAARAEVVRARADLKRSEAELDGAAADVNRYEVLARNAQDKLRDTEAFYKQKATTDFELRDTRAAAEAAAAQAQFSRSQLVTAQRKREWTAAAIATAEANVVSAQASVTAAETELTAAQASVDRAAVDITMAESTIAAAQAICDIEAKRLRDCQVLAPITGVVLERSATVGDYVTEGGGRGGLANSQFVTLADTDNLRVEVDVTEQDIAKITPGMPTVIIPDAVRSRRFDGRVMWIDPIGNYSKATVQVKVRIDKTRADDAALRIEGAVKVEFREATPVKPGESQPKPPAGPSIYVPLAAVQNAAAADATQGRVQIVDPVSGGLRIGEVKLGRRVAGQVEIISGLSAGQVIIAEFDDTLRQGQVIKRVAS